MKKAALVLIAMFVLVFSVLGEEEKGVTKAKKFSKGSMYVTGQIGFNSYVATDEPFDAMPFPIGASYEFFIADNIGIGSKIMFDKWCDYLGVFGGKWTFRVFKPSLYIKYHFDLKGVEGIGLFAGADLGYSVFSASNELGSDYWGDLKSGLHLAPFLGTNLYFWENLSGFFDRFLVTLKANWSVAGDFSGLGGTVGITFRIK
ncbi:MAG: hypothetical protein JSV96_18655 [Candidatus Aminicenantes bacterium]|nr:MAG: hypothetical protein JSV96_18655 [Candidatus Aminicenantes bacterium]